MAASQQALNDFSTDHLQADLKERSVRGGAVTLTSQGMQFALQSISTVTLAHMLAPADFGLVAMAATVTMLGQAFADLGLSEATIQHPEINHDQVSKLFWLNVAIGLGLTIVNASFAPFLAWFYHDERLKAIAYAFSLTFLIGGLRVQHDALLQRSMRFFALAIRDVTAYALAVPMAIFLAWRGAGYWAIVALPLLINGIMMVLSWVMAGWMPGLPRRDAKVRHLVRFGGDVAASYLTIAITGSSDDILIGWRWGAGPLGLYSRAMNLLLLPIRQLSGPARKVAVPAFSRLQDDPDRLARYYLRTTNLVVWITAPIFGLLFVVATPLIVLTLGEQWRAAAQVFKILVIFSLGQLLYESLTWLLIGRGQSRRLLALALILCPITIGSYAIGLPFGIRGVAFSGALIMFATFPWVLHFGLQGTKLTLLHFGKNLICPVITCFAGIGTGQLAIHAVGRMSPLPQILIVAAAFAAGCLSAVSLKPVRREAKQLKDLLRSLRAVSSVPLAENLD
jgi:O-antigen/teichoic acid export membrane protein